MTAKHKIPLIAKLTRISTMTLGILVLGVGLSYLLFFFAGFLSLALGLPALDTSHNFRTWFDEHIFPSLVIASYYLLGPLTHIPAGFITFRLARAWFQGDSVQRNICYITAVVCLGAQIIGLFTVFSRDVISLTALISLVVLILMTTLFFVALTLPTSKWKKYAQLQNSKKS